MAHSAVSPDASSSPGLPVHKKAAFALGDHTINVSLGALSLVFFTFLVKIAGLEPWLAGVLTWVARIVDAVSDPLMGHVSDATRWRIGRRRPYFLIGMLPFALSFALLWRTPFDTQFAMFVYYLAVYVFLCLSMTVLSVPYMALIPEMATGYDERTTLNAFRSAAAIAGTMVAAAFIGIADALGGGAQGFAHTGLYVAVWLALPWPLAYWASFELTRAPQGAAGGAAAGQSHFRHALRQSLGSIRSIARHTNYVRLVGFYLCSRMAVDLLGLAVPLYIADVIGRRGDIHWTLLSMLGVVILSLPFWLRIAHRLDKNRIYVVGAIWFVGCLGLVGIAAPEWPRWTMFAIAGLLGVGYAVTDLMPWAMLGEVIDEDELRGGVRRDGVYNGVFTFIRKVGGASAFMLAGVALSLSGYERGDDVQPPEALFTIRIITAIVPAGLLAISLAIALRYPLGRRQHAEILRALSRRRATAGGARGG